MANRNTQGFGLIAAGTLGQTPAIQGQGKYKIDAPGVAIAQLYTMAVLLFLLRLVTLLRMVKRF